MKGADFSGSNKPVRIVAANGALPPAKKNGVEAKQPSETAPSADVSAPDFLAAPIADEATPIDSPMWPLHPLVWFQPESAPSAPVWTGLAIAHQNRLPAPDFQVFETTPFDWAGVRKSSCDPLAPATGPVAPPSGLEPLGWDPRAVCWKKGRE
jgi:hypothetical protein